MHLEAYIGRVSVFVEAIAIAMASAAGDTELGGIVAENREGRVFPPCGMYHELIPDYASDYRVILTKTKSVTISDLLHRNYPRGN